MVNSGGALKTLPEAKDLVIGTLPEGYRPISGVVFNPYTAIHDANFQLQILPNGDVRLYNYGNVINGNVICRFCVTFIAY